MNPFIWEQLQHVDPRLLFGLLVLGVAVGAFFVFYWLHAALWRALMKDEKEWQDQQRRNREQPR